MRQYHEDHQEEVSIDWADLFFDLTYVAAANQLGHLFRASVSWMSFVYFGCLALVLIDSWKFKTLHDSTFSSVDITHKLYDVTYVCTVASAALFIQPLDEMKDLRTGYMFGLAMSLALNALMMALLKLEIFLRSKNGRARQYCRLELLIEVLPRLACYLTAAVLAGMGNYTNATSPAAAFDPRTLVLVVLGAHALGTLGPLGLSYAGLLPAGTELIPWHYEHIAERYGAWIMLMLGEAVLSIVLEPVRLSKSMNYSVGGLFCLQTNLTGS